jgi:predicted permease
MDWRVLAFGAAVSLLTGILFGLFPAIAGSRADLNTVLKESSGRSGTGLRQNKTRSILVVSEVALAVVLLVGAALLIRSFIALYSVHSGFDGTGVLTMRMFLTGPNSKTTEGVTETIRDGLERVRALPSVVEATASCCIPLQGNATLPFLIPSRPPVSGRFNGSAGWSVISSGYFDVFRIPLKRGRIFDDRDDGRSAPVVLVNEAFARQFLKDADPLNERIVIGRGLSRDFAAEQPRQIVGVVGDVRTQALGAEPPPMMYVPQPQLSDAENQFLVRLTPLGWVARTRGEPHRIAAAMEDQLRQAAGLPVSEVYSMDDLMARSTARQRFNMLLMTVFGAMALLLAAIGIYGLMAYTVAQRKQEIGIRLALGAARTEVIGMVVKQGMRLALAGMAAGLAAAWALSRVMESFLFGVRARDPLVFAAVPLVLALVAFFAVWLPAIRAGKVNPVESIRYE